MNSSRTQIETDIQCRLELLGRLESGAGYSGIELHRHPFFEIFYISKGSYSVFFNTNSQTLSNGDLYIIAPDVNHRFVSDNGGEMLYVGIALNYGVEADFPDYCRVNNADVAETMERICCNTSKNGAAALRSSLRELMLKLTALILSVVPCKNTRQSDTLSEKVKGYLRHRFTENITLKDICI